MVTNKVFEALALTATNHTHGGYKHIICTADEPYSTLLEPIIHIDHSL
jgi:pimeloyl-CoA synthetase